MTPDLQGLREERGLGIRVVRPGEGAHSAGACAPPEGLTPGPSHWLSPLLGTPSLQAPSPLHILTQLSLSQCNCPDPLCDRALPSPSAYCFCRPQRLCSTGIAPSGVLSPLVCFPRLEHGARRWVLGSVACACMCCVTLVPACLTSQLRPGLSPAHPS